jgi:acetolactate synthase-1/2/3 large subunit
MAICPGKTEKISFFLIRRTVKHEEVTHLKIEDSLHKGYQSLKNSLERYTTADAMMDALKDAGVSFIFANLGSDHPAIIESWAKREKNGSVEPEIIICPHEAVALSAAHGYAAVTGKAQAVFVHVDVGTQNLGGALHNAQRGRIPAFIFAGTSPFTMEGEMIGSRNEYIHFYQDVYDQRGFVRENTKWNYEARSGKNIKQIIYRALQMAESDPKGPVYLMAAREVLDEEVLPIEIDKKNGWGSIAPTALPPDGMFQLAEDLLKAKNPLIITTCLGRNEEAVAELVQLSEKMAIPIVEAGPYYVNFPSNHPMHLGYMRNNFVSEADFILVLDSDVPWIPSQVKPNSDCNVYYIDVDPLKEDIPLWYIPSKNFFKADSAIALKQLNQYIDSGDSINVKVVQDRFQKLSSMHDEQRKKWGEDEKIGENDTITPEWLTACIREVIDDNTIIINEAVTNVGAAWKHLQRTKPGTLYGSGGSSLGWNGGAAIGAKLAAPDKTVISLTGDGTYIFSSPTAVHWIARKYRTPFMTVVYNNEGWKAPKQSTLGVHPVGLANQKDQFWVNFDPAVQYDKVAEAAGGAFARTVVRPEDVKGALLEGLREVNQGRCSVINVILEPGSKN